MVIKISDFNLIRPFLNKLYIPPANSHKGQNGRVLVIGGSSLFHSASIWAAEIASHFVDIVHYSSTKENNEIILGLKKKFTNGIVVPREHLTEYVVEDDVVLVGPGMLRCAKGAISNFKFQISNFDDLLTIQTEGEYTYFLTKYLVENYPQKKFVFDAGALQMMEKEWLLQLQTKPVLTPHRREYEQLFEIDLSGKNQEELIKDVEKQARKYHCIILLKAVIDIISDGSQTYVIQGGNAGLTKGGTGDVLAGLVTAFFAKNQGIDSSVLASFVLKKTAEELSKQHAYWFNIDELIFAIPHVLSELMAS